MVSGRAYDDCIDNKIANTPVDTDHTRRGSIWQADQALR